MAQPRKRKRERRVSAFSTFLALVKGQKTAKRGSFSRATFTAGKSPSEEKTK
jgi:hypothetical protein